MGAVAGGATGVLLNNYFAADISPALYAMLGMGAMMGATLNAPLAALTALLELTYNPHIILPSMLAIVAAGLTSGQLFGTSSIFLHMLQMRGLMSPAIDPVSQFLRRLGVSMSMDRRVRQLPPVLDHQQFDELQKNPPTWLLLRKTRPRPQLIFTADLIRWKEARSGSESEPESGDKNATEQSIDLQDIPVQRRDIAPISARATLLGALRKMEGKNLDALYVVSVHSGRVLGIITRQAIERSYRNPMS
jgi:CIC family chloride channel protein